MAIGRTARGTFSGLAPVTTITTGSATVGATGSTLEVALGVIDAGNGPADSVTWNGAAMTLSATAGTGNPYSFVYTLQNATAGSGTIVISIATAVTWTSYAITVTEVTGAATVSVDKTKTGAGTSTTPSTGASATLSQAAELCVAACAWQNTAISGSWGNSFTAGQNVTVGATTAAIALEEGYKTVAATTAVTANKTGATNKSWAIALVTYKEASLTPTSVTLAALSAAATMTAPSRADAVTLGATSAAATLPSVARSAARTLAALSAAATLPAVTRKTARTLAALSAAASSPSLADADAEALPSLTAAATFPEPAFTSRFEWPIPEAATAPDALTPAQTSHAASVGLKSNGESYFALVQADQPAGDDSSPGWFSDPAEVQMMVAIHAAPEELSWSDEPHWLFSFHQVGGSENVALGVTPDLRLVGYTWGRGLIYSAPGVVVPDGQFRRWSFKFDDTRTLSIDSQALVVDGTPGQVNADGFHRPGDLTPTRLMAFNGVAGLTRCACSILGIAILLDQHNFVWPFTEGSGYRAAGFECSSGLGDPVVEVPLGEEIVQGVDWTLVARWYDPRPAYPLSFDSIPTDDVGRAFHWLMQTIYRKAQPARPDYRRNPAWGGS